MTALTPPRRLVLTLSLIAIGLLMSGCGANRPEGPSERYLAAISRDTDADAINRFGELAVAEELLGFGIEGTAEENQAHIDRHEIGPAVVDGDSAVVPVQIWRGGSEEPENFELELELTDGRWRVTGAAPSADDVSFPSEGGTTYGVPPGRLALLAGATFLAAFTVAIVIVRLSGARPVHKREESRTP